jgi:hypothetical protein
MRILYYASVLLLIRGSLDAAGQNPAPLQTDVETIVFLRHGEKPPGGLGQLTCQGLNRALALPPVLISKFGKADYIFAPDPAGKVTEGGLRQFDYLRRSRRLSRQRSGWVFRSALTSGIMILAACSVSLRDSNTIKHSYLSLGNTPSWIEW